MAKQRYASIKPSEAAAGGGKFTIPAGAVCTVTDETEWSTWGDAGEGALKGNRKADDPAMKLVVDVEDSDEPMTEFLSAGKQHSPSKDGQYLEPGDVNLPEGSNSHVFLSSLVDKKTHGKLALPEDDLEDGIKGIYGLKFVAGRKKITREGLDGDSRPVLVAEEILKLPKGGGGRKQREEEEEERPARRGKAREEEKEDDVDEAAEAGVIETLGQPKYKKGLPLDKAFAAVYTVVKGTEHAKEIGKLVQDEDWMTDKKRPWESEEREDGTVITLP